MTANGNIPMGIMGKAEARALTDEVKADAHAIWTKLLKLFEGKAHKALGYGTWGDYYEVEFGGSVSQANKLLAAGRVLESLEPEGFRGNGSPGSPLLTERGARELQPLLRAGAHVVREAYEEAVEQAGGAKPPARVIREVVRRRTAPGSEPSAPVVLDAVPDPAPGPPVDPEPPDWVGRMDDLASELTWLVSGNGSGHEENARAARRALDLIPRVIEDLERLAG